MKTIIAGSRTLIDYAEFCEILYPHKKHISEVVCGMALHWLWEDDYTAGGVDRMAYRWAKANAIPIKEFKPSDKHSSPARFFIRNEAMGDYADKLIAIWDGSSKGTKHMIQYMKKLQKPLEVHYRNHPDNKYTKRQSIANGV